MTWRQIIKVALITTYLLLGGSMAYQVAHDDDEPPVKQANMRGALGAWILSALTLGIAIFL